MTLFGDRTFNEVIKIEIGSYDGPSSNVTAILVRRENSDTQKDPRDVCAQRNDSVRIQQESGHLQAKEKASGETIPDAALNLDSQPPDLCKNMFLLFKFMLTLPFYGILLWHI